MLTPLDIAIFAAFIVTVISVGLYKSTGEELHSEHGAQDYFLAGRGLGWTLVGFSLIAANISTEQFVGMSGKAADWLGMAIASYEWMAAITLVGVAFIFLPKFLRCGIYTIPEFLEYRYSPLARTIMAVSSMIILVGVPTASVIYSGAKVICVFFKGATLGPIDFGDITVGCWIIGVLAAVYVFAGGLKACAWADLIQGAALIVGGGVVAYFALTRLSAASPADLTATVAGAAPADLEGVGALGRLQALNPGKLTMFREASDPEIPWTALMLGLWIPNFFYWGLNQYIMQRALGSKSLAEGQRGIVFAAFLKLLIPFVVVIPGILAYNLFAGDLRDEAVGKNAPVIAAFEKARANPAEAREVFQFNEDFAEWHPDTAAAILQFNARMLGQTPMDAVPETPAERVNANKPMVASAADSRIAVRTMLIGYDTDAAFPTLLRNLLPVGTGLRGFVLAAIFGAVVSSLASMLNSAATIFTMDIYHKARKTASQYELVSVGRACTVVFVLIAMTIAPYLDSPRFGGIFTFIQEFQGFISPGILAVFVFGLLIPKAPRFAGMLGLVLNPILYGAMKWFLTDVSFLNRMAYCFLIVLGVLALATLLKPLREPLVLPENTRIPLVSSRSAKLLGAGVIALTILLYVVFSPIGLG
jgi:SSS family solute:Na+ symporter